MAKKKARRCGGSGGHQPCFNVTTAIEKTLAQSLLCDHAKLFESL